MICKICHQQSSFLLKAVVLKKYEISYFKCPSCSFIQTEDPYWLTEAYSSAIANADIGLIYRNQQIAPKLEMLIDLYFESRRKFIDYGGGYGMLVRMMRDKGFDYYRQDIYCENLFAKSYDLEDIDKAQTFELLTAFEVFEHLVDPLPEIEKMFKLSDNIFFSTNVQPNDNVTPENWWYFVPLTGQHIALYSNDSLNFIAAKFNKKLYQVENDLFLFTSKEINLAKMTKIRNSRLARWKYNRFEKKHLTSLLDQDFQKILNS